MRQSVCGTPIGRAGRGHATGGESRIRLTGRQPQPLNVEGQFDLERAPDTVSQPKLVSLPGEGKEDVPDAPATERLELALAV
jgi:hypothetical protein